jgi:hypothetical protein
VKREATLLIVDPATRAAGGEDPRRGRPLRAHMRTFLALAERAARVAFVTGDTLTSALRDFAAASGRPVIEKPFLPVDVRRVVAELAASVTGGLSASPRRLVLLTVRFGRFLRSGPLGLGRLFLVALVLLGAREALAALRFAVREGL